MASTSNTMKLNIIRDHLAHFSNEEAAIRNRISKGTVDNVLKEFRAGLIPGTANLVEDAEVTREIAGILKKFGLQLGDALIGLSVLAQCRQHGLDPADMNRWGTILKAAEDEAGAEAFVRDVYRVLEILEDSGLPLEGLKATVESLNAQRLALASVEEEYGEAVEKTEQLTKQRDDFVRQVDALKEKHALVSAHLKELVTYEQSTSQRIAVLKVEGDQARDWVAAMELEKATLRKAGLSSDDFAELNYHLRGVARRREKPVIELKTRLYKALETLDILVDLENQVQACRKAFNDLKETMAATGQEKASLIAQIGVKKQEAAALEQTVEGLRVTIVRGWADLMEQAKAATAESLGWLNQRIKEEMGIFELIAGRAMVAGNNAGQIEGYFKAKDWYQNVPDLIKGDKQIEKIKVAQIMISLLNGFAQWLKQNQSDKNSYALLHQMVTELSSQVQTQFYFTITMPF